MSRQDTQLLRKALEKSGRGVILLSRNGRVRQISSQASGWLSEYFGHPARESGYLPEPLQSFIRHEDAVLRGADAVPHSKEPLRIERDRKCLLILHLCDTNRCLLLLEEERARSEPVACEALALTKREAEVVHWIIQGKTNTEIGAILTLSPRTVQKHLEHIFKKLGVETRAAAAMLARDQGY